MLIKEHYKIISVKRRKTFVIKFTINLHNYFLYNFCKEKLDRILTDKLNSIRQRNKDVIINCNSYLYKTLNFLVI